MVAWVVYSMYAGLGLGVDAGEVALAREVVLCRNETRLRRAQTAVLERFEAWRENSFLEQTSRNFVCKALACSEEGPATVTEWLALQIEIVESFCHDLVVVGFSPRLSGLC